jgi:amino acid transporter
MGLLHERNLTPHRAIWTLAAISAVIGCITVSNLFGDGGALSDATVKALPQGFWSSFGYLSHDKMAALPNSLITVTLASNFGTFVLYALSCVLCMVAFHKHPRYSPVRHLVVPIFGLVANLACMAFYLIGPFLGYGTKLEPLMALGVALVWGIYGWIYFLRSSKASGRTTLVTQRPAEDPAR